MASRRRTGGIPDHEPVQYHTGVCNVGMQGEDSMRGKGGLATPWQVTTRGFTLLELLVVVSIISLLLAICLPPLRQGREQSKQLVCRNNLTNMWRGILVYSVEFNDRVPFMERISPTVDPFDPQYPTLIGNVLGPYVERDSFLCPSAVNGYPEDDPNSRRRWKLTYEFSTADRVGDSVPYDEAEGAFTGRPPDPAVVNDYHFDGRPLRTTSVQRQTETDGYDGTPGDEEGEEEGDKVEIIWTVSVPLIADKLCLEYRYGGLNVPRYPHRGVVRRQADVYRSLVTTPDPRLVSGRRPGYFHLHAEQDRCEVFLTRYSPDLEPPPK